MKIGTKAKLIKLGGGTCSSLHKYIGHECEIVDIFGRDFKVIFADGRSFYVFPGEIEEIK